MTLFRKFTLLFIAAFLVSKPASAQKFLAIDKEGKIKRLRFYVHDKINIRLNDEAFFRSGQIDSIADTSFIFSGKNIPVKNVNAVLVYKNKGGHAFLKEASGKLPIGGAFLLSVTAVNSLINHSYPLVPARMYIICGGIAATGFALHPLTFRIYHAAKHPLKIIDVTIAGEEN